MSRMRTTPPLGLVRTMILSNCGSAAQFAWRQHGKLLLLIAGTGGSPIWPAATWMFCAWIAAMTSLAVIPSAVIFTGFSHTRMAYWRSPKMLVLPTPGMRAICCCRCI